MIVSWTGGHEIASGFVPKFDPVPAVSPAFTQAYQPRNPVYARRVDPSALALILSPHRDSYVPVCTSPIKFSFHHFMINTDIGVTTP
jgi:hypothetical protein